MTIEVDAHGFALVSNTARMAITPSMVVFGESMNTYMTAKGVFTAERLSCAGAFIHTGDEVEIKNKAAWRKALGLDE